MAFPRAGRQSKGGAGPVGVADWRKRRNLQAIFVFVRQRGDRMPAKKREKIELSCSTCGRAGWASVGYGSERVTASAVGGFIVVISGDQDGLYVVCSGC